MPVRLPRPVPGELVSSQWRALASKSPEFDVAVIGGGSAGYAAARTATALGAKTIVIEGGPEIGGLCILRGCMPSKALLESAHRWHEIKRAREFGLVAKAVEVNMPCVQERKRHLVGEFASYRSRQLRKGDFAFLRGRASFLDPHTLLVERRGVHEIVTASTVILAAGSVIIHVPVPGLWENDCLTSDTALQLDRIPKRLAVLGGGVIAAELGQFFARLGAKTTILQRSGRIVKTYDPDVSRELQKAFKAEGIDVRTNVKILEVSATKKGKKIRFLSGRKANEIEVDDILYALGRTPARDGLNLDTAGVVISDNRLVVDETMATSVPHIFAAGDIVGSHDVVHIAIQQGECAARNAVRLLRGDPAPAEKVDYRLKALVTFTDPEIASVGLTEEEATGQGIAYIAASYPFKDHGKSMIGGHEFGFVKVLAEKTRGEIVGAQIIGPHASDLIHELIAIMRYRGTAYDLATMPHYHPTLAEILTYPAEEIVEKLAKG
jgi:pyruvate/2-oxoglutarate dehydrogenase complex dihydrolipoamide dehydrogenase (E3) component